MKHVKTYEGLKEGFVKLYMKKHSKFFKHIEEFFIELVTHLDGCYVIYINGLPNIDYKSKCGAFAVELDIVNHNIDCFYVDNDTQIEIIMASLEKYMFEVVSDELNLGKYDGNYACVLSARKDYSNIKFSVDDFLVGIESDKFNL